MHERRQQHAKQVILQETEKNKTCDAAIVELLHKIQTITADLEQIENNVREAEASLKISPSCVLTIEEKRRLSALK